MVSVFEQAKLAAEAKKKAAQAGSTTPAPVEAPKITPVETPKNVEKVETTATSFSSPQAQTQDVASPSPPPAVVQPITPQPMQQPKLNDAKFALNPIKDEEAIGVMIYGGKGEGKTTLALSPLLNGESICAFSFDYQTYTILKQHYKNDPKCTVVNALEHYSENTPEETLESSVVTLDFMLYLLEHQIKEMKPDWILIDALEIFKEKCELKMRAFEKLRPFENFSNGWAFWRERNLYMDIIDRKAKEVARKGVIYTSYIKTTTIKNDKNETTIVEPKWAGNTKFKTRLVIKVSAEDIKEGRNFYATVESSKIGEIPTGPKKLVGTVNDKGVHTILGLNALKVTQQ